MKKLLPQPDPRATSALRSRLHTLITHEPQPLLSIVDTVTSEYVVERSSVIAVFWDMMSDYSDLAYTAQAKVYRRPLA